MALRWRIAALVAAVACGIAATVGILVHHASRARELSQARDMARTTLDRAAVAYARTGSVQGTGAALDPPGVPAGLRALVSRGHQGTEFAPGPGGPDVWAGRPAAGHVLAVRVNLAPVLRDLDALDATIAWAGLLTTGVVLPLGVFTAGRMSRRLRTAAGTARRIAAGDLDARISAAQRPRDEIAEISTAVDTMAAALQERLHNEQRFTADVAHELRTPLMGLVTAAELLPDGEAAGFVRDRARVLSALVEDLLEVSRLDAGVEHADLSECRLVPLVEEVLARGGLSARLHVVRTVSAAGTDGAEDAGSTEDSGGPGPAPNTVGTASTARTVGLGGDPEHVDGAVSGTATVRTDPRRLERILTNLVANARRHGEPPVVVTVEADRRTVHVRDHGPGYPEGFLEDGPQRFRTGARERGTGHGLGLTIALGQAQVIRAELTFSNPQGGGALATLRLPAGAPFAEPPAEDGRGRIHD
ncbi:ATP-binding protein [Streptomyces sp. NPDC002004]